MILKTCTGNIFSRENTENDVLIRVACLMLSFDDLELRETDADEMKNYYN